MNLAINGGPKVRQKKFPFYNTISAEEKNAVMEVLDSGNLSDYLGCWDPCFYGGPKVKELEKQWREKFKSKHAYAVNSATSGLYAALGAIGIGPGDEVIVSPYTMSASAVCPIIYGGIPVFADIEPDHFCLSPRSIRDKITKKTKAIVVVDIFGQPYDRDEINKIANEHNLFVIEDTAQAPGALYKGQFAGTLGDIGVFSLNYHKHIHSGEGGIVVTNDDNLAERISLIRNHAESVVEAKGVTDLINMVGFNYRMTEIEAAIAACQLKKLDNLLEKRQQNAQYLYEKITQIPAITGGGPRQDTTHGYYILPLVFDKEVAGIERDKFIQAVSAELEPHETREDEGPLIYGGYVKPLHLLPMFQKKIAIGKDGWPFSTCENSSSIDYSKGICPVAEEMHFEKLIQIEIVEPQLSMDDLDDVVSAFKKVWDHRGELE